MRKYVKQITLPISIGLWTSKDIVSCANCLILINFIRIRLVYNLDVFCLFPFAALELYKMKNSGFCHLPQEGNSCQNESKQKQSD